MAITHIRIIPKKKPDDERAPWRPKVGRYHGQDPAELPKSLPILVWELLKADARGTDELSIELGATRRQIRQVIFKLRRHGQIIERRRGEYHLVGEQPLEVEETCSGLKLAPTRHGIRKLTDAP